MDELISFGIIVLFLVLLTAIIATPIVLIDKYAVCPNYGESVQLETKYNFLAGGCFVKYKGQWINNENFRVGTMK